MPLHLGQRLHAFWNGMGRSSDEQEVRRLYAQVEGQFRDHGLLWDGGRDDLIAVIAKGVMETFELDEDHPQFVPVVQFVMEVMDYEDLFVLPSFDPNEQRSTSQWWELRDQLYRQRKLFADFDQSCDAVRIFACAVFDELWKACPSLLSEDNTEGIQVPGDLFHLLGHPGSVVHRLADFVFSPDFKEAGVFDKLRPTLEYNLIIASGGNPADPKAFSQRPKYAKESGIRDPERLVKAYLGGTPLASVFDQSVSFTIPTRTRFEHHHIVAGTGHGKTQTLQYMMADDIRAVERGERSVVVLDSQGDLIHNISNLSIFAPGGALEDKLVIIDPTDVEYPVSLNLFDVGQERLSGYAPLERERLTNSILELYDFVLGTLLDAQMTQKQAVIFRYVTRLLLHIPDATVHTLLQLMEPKAEDRFSPHIAKLSGSARHFFDTEFSSREFEQTKRQVSRRLWGILENQTFERMFSHPKSKLDLFSEMNAGKVILINTAKDLLKESGTEIFGRFFIALIAQAAQERAVLPAKDRMPTMVYIDEAADYFDRNIGIILSQARKYKVGMVLAHQYLGQLTPSLQEAFAANTSIKFAGGVSAKDARILSQGMYCEPQLLESQPKLSFAAHVRGITPQAVPLQFPYGLMEKLPRMSKPERYEVQQRMRELYATHYSELSSVGDEPERADDQEPIDPNEPTPHW